MGKKKQPNKPIVGSIVFATEQGLGYLAKDFYDSGIIDKVLVQKHGSRETKYDWYPERCGSVEQLVTECDVLFFFETVFNWRVMTRAKSEGVKTILMPMYECTQYPFPYKFDMLTCPSLLDMDYYPNEEKVYMDVPIPKWVKWKERKKAEVFVHNAGNGGLGMRNGTPELIEAMKYVKSPIKLIIRSQNHEFNSNDKRIEFVHESVPRETLYAEGDVFIFPEKFNGLSLPMQEAYASGMPVMATLRYPIDLWLPNDLLIEPVASKRQSVSRRIDVAVHDPKRIAEKIDEWYGKDITSFSHAGKEFGKNNSWSELKEDYLQLIKQVCET